MNRITALLLGSAASAAVVVTAGLSAAAPAMASPAASSARTVAAAPAAAHRVGNYKICLKSDNLECLTSEGTGQMKIFQTGYSTFNESIVNQNLVFTNQSGNCVHGTDSGTVTVSSSCGSGNTASQWNDVDFSGNLELQNVAYGGYISTKGDTSGDNVFLQAQGTGGAWFAEVIPIT